MQQKPVDAVLASDAEGVLAAALSAAGTSFTLQAGQGAAFPASDFSVEINGETIDVGTRTADTFSSLTRANPVPHNGGAHGEHVYHVTSGATIADAVAAGPGGSQTVEVVTRPFTSAEILSLDTVPIELVPSPGPGFVLVPLNLVWVYRFVTTPYDQAGVANVDWTGGSLGLCAAEAALNRPEDRISYGYATTESRKVLTTAEDRGLVLSIDVPVVDGDGTGFAVLSYMTVPLA